MASVVSVLRAGALLGCLALTASGAIGEPLRAPCRVADEYLALNGKLDRAASHLKDSDGFKILVIGSSSTAGVGATSPNNAYTARLQQELAQRLPGVSVTVVARGVGGETAIGAEARLSREISSTKPDLVVWQIGTNDAARRLDLATFRRVAAEGLKAISGSGVDVAMLDPQFVPQDEASYEPYIDVLESLAEANGVPLARRYDAMRAMAKAGGAAMLSRDRLHMNDVGHACVGAFLAEALDRKLAPTPPAVAEAGRQS
ncbi:SGNH/GDSL hydrolase family protein [Hansschlegelia beijingensis]|uniref:SGNH/GDSL hydrolase family protein n=1 Tax=Hansschlegelia beijingensis TaxID=1133344 RepID=UPI0038272261